MNKVSENGRFYLKLKMTLNVFDHEPVFSKKKNGFEYS